MSAVYLIQAFDTNHFKIGITKRKLSRRLNELQTGNGLKLELVAKFKTKYGTKLESRLHKHFDDKRIEGEWFVLEDKDIIEFEAICAKYEKNFDVLSENYFTKKYLEK